MRALPDEARRRARYHTEPAAHDSAASPATATTILTDARSGRVVDLDGYRRARRSRLDWWPAWSVMPSWEMAAASVDRGSAS